MFIYSTYSDEIKHYYSLDECLPLQSFVKLFPCTSIHFDNILELIILHFVSVEAQKDIFAIKNFQIFEGQLNSSWYSNNKIIWLSGTVIGNL